MGEDLDTKTKIEIYKIVLDRYKNLITEKESHSISEIRQKVSPYNDVIRNIRDKITHDIPGYDYQKDFFTAAQKAMVHIRNIRTCEFAFTFWMDLKAMEELKIGTAIDKAILFAAILRSLGSEDVRVLVTKKDKPYVKFNWKTEYIFVPDTGSTLMGEDSMNLFSDDPVAYSFNDLVYENHEEE